ncbi:MAG TPA: c-type cytochrome [Chitinophagales bacterium]|nr:c-type cytochrome [Chitinophagales bacterium]
MNVRISVRFLFLFSFLSFSVFSASAGDAAAGEKVFKANCASCHKPDKKMIGPAMKGSEQRWIEHGDFQGVSGREWLNRWVRNSQEVIKAGHPYANKLFSEYNKSVMTAFTTLTDADIANVLAYVETYTPPAAPAAQPGVSAQPTESPFTSLFLYALIALLLFIVFILSRLTANLNKMALQKQGLPVPETVPIHKNKKIWVTLILVLFIYIGYSAVLGAIDLGRQQGYMPDQPIKYSHALHAGINKINCRYCHGGALRGKQAGIPSPNICMNCHKGIQEGAVNGKYGRKEITKIYASIGFDPNTLTYIKDYHKMDAEEAKKLYTEWLRGDEKHTYTQKDIDEVLAFIGKPIEWVRVHNLPDHVYFNHSQHVVAGNIECQTCHGPVETMEEMYQFAPLSMGWCINCHRTTEVNFAKNNFYDDYRQLHEDLKNGKIDKVTVDKIGGIECQRCHY